MNSILSSVMFIVRIIIFSVVSWIIIHLLAVSGFFIALAYPILGLLAPGTILCLFCKINERKGFCPVCKKNITKDLSPSSFKSIFLNAILIALITLSTIGVVLIEKDIIERSLGVHLINKTVELDIRSNRTIYQNRVSPVKLFLRGINEPINVVQVDIDFNPDEMEVLEFIEKDSFAEVFVEKNINNEVGFIRIASGIPNPGYSEDTAYVGSLLVRPKITGLIKLQFLPSTLVLANDGKATNVLSSLGDIALLVLPETDIAPLSDEKVVSDLVLGATEEGKIYFYDKDGTVQGARNDDTDSVEEKKPWWFFILELIVKFDKLLLKIYEFFGFKST